MSYLFRNLLFFGRVLRQLGLDVQAGAMLEVAQALEYVDIGRERDFYHALRTLLVHRQQDLPLFDEAFRVFWRRRRRRPDQWTTTDLRSLGERRRFGPPQVDPAPPRSDSSPQRQGVEPVQQVDRVQPQTYSPREVSRAKDFAQFTAEEVTQARIMMAELKWDLGLRHSRRWVAGRGPNLDLRRTIRKNMKYGAELLELPHRRRKDKRRRLVVICDVSGSMERYTRMLLYFLHCVAGGLDEVEAFLFATRLTRITRHLARHGVDRAVTDIPRVVPDWAGGTRIGQTLRAFNVRWARRILAHGSVVLLISDGWDRGDPALLRGEMARLQRSCHRLIWLNPLLGSPAYVPLTRGMQAALPFVDDFLPVHNLASLEALATHLNALPPERPVRRQQGLSGGAALLGLRGRAESPAPPRSMHSPVAQPF